MCQPCFKCYATVPNTFLSHDNKREQLSPVPQPETKNTSIKCTSASLPVVPACMCCSRKKAYLCTDDRIAVNVQAGTPEQVAEAKNVLWDSNVL